MLFIREAEMQALREMVDLFEIMVLIDKGQFDEERRAKGVINNLCKILGVSQTDTILLLERQERRK